MVGEKKEAIKLLDDAYRIVMKLNQDEESLFVQEILNNIDEVQNKIEAI
tara:strand:+ start:367 stop:513 length:147 start_codon:yes stop_codon:yes gene_type:complete